jgi:hypothetical protein
LLGQEDREDTLLAFIVDARVETQLVDIEVAQRLDNLLRGSEIKFVSI